MRRGLVSSHQAPIQNLDGSQTSLSLVSHLSPLLDPTLQSEQTTRGELLIPGITDDVALLCLLCVSIDDHAASKAVCKRWYTIFRSKAQFFTSRKELALSHPWLIVLAFDKSSKKIEWKVLDVTRFSWHSLPAMPCREDAPAHGFNCVAIPNEGVLYVCGGVVFDADYPLNLLMKYQVFDNSWTVMQKMTAERSFFANGVIGGMVYVAGGNGPDLFELNSGEVYDPRTDLWKPISKMCTNMASYDAAVVDGKLLVTEGWFWPFYVRPMGQIYDPTTDKWEIMAAGLREGWTGPSFVMHGHLFVMIEHEKTRIKVYDEEYDCWSMVEGPSLPEKICKPLCVSSWECKVYVVGHNMHVVVGNVFRICGEKCRFCVQWELVDAPQLLGHLTPSSSQILLA